MKVRISRNLFVILVMDIVLLFGSITAAHLIRFDFAMTDLEWERFYSILPYTIIVKLCWFYYCDLYRGMWRYTSLTDLINIVKAATLSTLCIIVLILYVNRFEGISRSAFIIDWCLTIILVVGLRVFTRLCFAQFTENIGIKELKRALLQIFRIRRGGGKGILIIGAGDCGEMICREFRENASVNSYVVGFLDDDRAKLGRKIHGFSVLGTIDDLVSIVEVEGVDEVIIAIPSAGSEGMRRIVNLCKTADVAFKTVPNMGELIDGKIDITSIRSVEYRDLLGRKPVKLDKEEIGKYLGGKQVLVSGAGGSIGTGLCRQICRYHPTAIILLERAESPLYEIDLELKKAFPDVMVVPVLGDIQNIEELSTLFSESRPDIVFHAAAYKHVPMLEAHPWKAVRNNIIGTRNLVETAKNFECEKFVFVSTDKAVNPTNVMGTSKRVCELLVQQMSCDPSSKTCFMTVRFGNVIGSVGSVIPLFKKQIKEGGPVTVTHPDIIRYFMLIPEACQLILQAGAMGKGGEIFLLEMGEPVKIDNMARDLIRFSGFEPDVDIKIEYTGLRPGEKLYEELMTDHEDVVPTEHKKIMVLNTNCLCLDALDEDLQQLCSLADSRDHEGIRKLMQKMVPEYTPK